MTARKSIKNSFKLPRIRLRLITWIFLFIAAVAIPTIIKNTFFPTEIEAAWWNEGWLYRQRIDVTNNESSDLTDFQIQITLDTATLITADKMQSDCDDIRITDYNGQQLPFWIETGGKACNTATTAIWVKVPTLPADNGVIYFYYGNSSSTISAHHNGDQTFEFFDDFSTDSLGTKWTGTTSDFTIASGNLSGSNSNSRIQSNISFTGDYELITRTYTTTNIANGFEVGGFWASTTNSHGVLNHNNTVYTRNDSAWPSNGTFAFNGQWTRLTNKVVGTAGSISLTGETSGSNTPSNTNSGISAEYIALGRRYDNSDQGQTYDADWDWLFVKKATTNEPSLSAASEEVTPGPVAFWKFDEGVDNTCSGGTNDVCDSTSQGNDGAFSGTAPTWKTEEFCVSGKCVDFDGTSGETITFADDNSLDFGADSFTISAWAIHRDYTYPKSNFMMKKSASCYIDGAANAGFDIGHNYHANGINLCFRDTSNNVVYSDLNFDVGFRPSELVNTWTHYSFVFNRSTGQVIIYINGVEQSNKLNISAVTGSINNTSSIIIGEMYGWKTDGKMDEIKIYPYARSADQVKQDYNALGGSSAGAVLGAQEQVFMSNGLVGYWKMDETPDTTTTVTDSSGNGNTGTINLWGGGNTATASARVAGKYGGGIDFDGGDDYLKMPSTVSDDIGNEITVSAWVYSDSFSENSVSRGIVADEFGQGDSDVEFTLYLSSSSHLLTAGFYNAGWNTVADATTFETGKWVHVVGTYDGNYIKLYKDGQLITTSANLNASLPSGTTGWRIGRRWDSGNAGDMWDGKIDETRIYNRALSAGEVAELYNWAPGPVAYWNMDEGTGNSVFDTSGNNLTLTAIDADGGNSDGDTPPPATRGKYGKSRDFDGIDDYLTIADNDLLDMGTNNFTVNAWIYADSFPSTTKFLGKSAGTVGWRWVRSGNTLLLEVYNGSWQSFGSTSSFLTTGEWMFITTVINRDQDTITFYKNGIFDQTTDMSSLSGVSFANSSSFQIGRDPWGYQYHDGKIDEVKIYNYARTPAQIQQDMGGVGGSILGSSTLPDPLLHLSLDEGYGAVAYDKGTNGDNGTLEEFASGSYGSGKVNKGLTFDGLNDHIRGFTSDPFEYTGGELTMSTWLKRDSGDTDNSDIFSKPWNGSGQYNYRARMNSNDTVTILLFGATSWNTTTTGTLSDSNWHHLAVTLGSDSSVKIYFDGKLEKSDTHNITSWVPGSGDGNISLSLGTIYPYGTWAGNTTYSFQGQLDEMKMYNATLSLNQIKKDMNGGSALKYSVGNSTADDITDGAGNPPVAEWNFDEKTGTSANDISGNGNTGTLTSGPTWTPGKIGSAINFDGSDDYITAADSASLSPTSAMSFSLWFNSSSALSSGSTRADLAYKSGAYYVIFNLGGDDGKISFITFDASNREVETTTTSWSANTWYHIEGTYDGSLIKIYVNGKLENTTSYSGSIDDSANALTMGGNGASNSFTGKIDHPKIYDYARTPAQIAYDYNGGLPIAHWRMDECQGTTINDSSGNSNSGTLTIGGSGTQTSAGTCNTASTAWGNGNSGKYNSSLNFDGTDDYISFPSTSYGIGNDVTVATWVKFTSTLTSPILSNRSGGGGKLYYGISGGKGFVYYNGSSPAGITTTEYINDGNWHHFVYVRSGTTSNFYIDGILDSAQTQTGYTAIDDAIRIGHDVANSTQYFPGQIDDVRIYNYALSPNQVKNIMNENASVRFGD